MIKVWGRPTSIHTQRVLWALADGDVPHELILASATMGPKGHVSRGGTVFGIVDTPAYRAMNPNGTVPTIDDAAKVEEARMAMLDPLGALEARLAHQAHVAGDRFSIGDIPTGAAVYRWLVFDLERPDMPNIAAWQARLAARKGFRAHVAPRAFHLAG